MPLIGIATSDRRKVAGDVIASWILEYTHRIVCPLGPRTYRRACERTSETVPPSHEFSNQWF